MHGQASTSFSSPWIGIKKESRPFLKITELRITLIILNTVLKAAIIYQNRIGDVYLLSTFTWSLEYGN